MKELVNQGGAFCRYGGYEEILESIRGNYNQLVIGVSVDEGSNSTLNLK